MEDYDKNKELSYLQYWDANNLYGWAMLQKLPVNNFEWTEDTSEFNEDFIKHYNEESGAGSFLEVDTQYLKYYMNFKMFYHFHQNKCKLKKSIKQTMLYILKN